MAMKKIILCLLLLLCVSCAKEEETVSSLNQGCDDACSISAYEYADMSGYEGFESEKDVFVETDVKGMLEMLEDNKTFVIYFGFERCPWCIAALPSLYQAAVDNDSIVYYVDTRKDEGVSSNIEIADYDLLVEAVGEYFELDDDDIPHLYTPYVFFVKEGKVVATHQGTFADHDATSTSLTAEQQAELTQIYNDYFALLK